MEVIKRKILLESNIDRTFNSPTWGLLTATTFYINVLITQNIDDMGLFTDIEFIPSVDNVNSPPDYTILVDKLSLSGITFPFMGGIVPNFPIIDDKTLRIPGKVESDYYNYGNLPINGSTDSKIEDVKSYNTQTPYIVGFNVGSESYINYKGITIAGVNRVTNLGEPKIYVFDGKNDVSLGTPNQTTGILYKDYTNKNRTLTIDGKTINIPVTNFTSIGEGWNETTISLSAITKEEYLFGIISPPEVQSDVFIDRGITTVMDKHLRMSEIKDLEMLISYGNGFYNLTRE